MSGNARVSILVVAIAVALLASACTTGVVASIPTSTSSPVSTAVPSPPPTTTPAATQSPASAAILPPSGQIPPGTYRSSYITFSVGDGWSSFQGLAVNKLDGNPPNGMFLAPWPTIATVYHDPCHWQTTGVPVGPKVADEVAALVAQKRGSTVTPVDVTIDSFRGKQIDLIVPLAVNFAACDEATYKSFTDASGGDRYNQGPGQHDLLDILDVNGKTLVIDRVFYPANTTADLAELKAIFDSIKITP